VTSGSIGGLIGAWVRGCVGAWCASGLASERCTLMLCNLASSSTRLLRNLTDLTSAFSNSFVFLQATLGQVCDACVRVLFGCVCGCAVVCSCCAVVCVGVCVGVRVGARACVRACVRTCVRAWLVGWLGVVCVCVRVRGCEAGGAGT